MALRDALSTEIRFCRFARIFNTYDDDDKATLIEWAENGMAAAAITAAIIKDNPDNATTPTTVLTHLRSRCSCPDGTPLKGTR